MIFKPQAFYKNAVSFITHAVIYIIQNEKTRKNVACKNSIFNN